VPFEASGSYFVDEDEEWVHYLGMEGELADAYYEYAASEAARKKAVKKKAATKKAADPVQVMNEAFIDSELSLYGTGRVVASQGFSSASSAAVPEPTGAALFGVGGLLIAGALRRRGARRR
jgi:hypothetical protein